MTERIVVIGADAAGMSAASQAKRIAGDAVEIVAFERGVHSSFSACGIPYWVAGDVDEQERLVARSPDEHRRNGIDIRMRTEVEKIDLGSHPKVDAVAPVCVRRTGDQTLRPVNIAGYPVRDATGRVGGVRAALERDDLDRVACDSLGLRGCAHPGRVRPDDDDPLGHGISTPHCLGRPVACVATGQAAPVVVRISVPVRTALVTGVFSAISASFARWSSPTPCRVISRSIHLVFLSLTT